MKTRYFLPLALLALAPLAANAASDNDFDQVVSALEQHYSAHAERLPMMGFVSLVARVGTVGAVKGIRVAEFDQFSAVDHNRDLENLLSASLGSEWQLFITDHETNGALSIIYVRPDGPALRMLIADYQKGELDLVRFELKGDRFKHWLQDPEHSSHNH